MTIGHAIAIAIAVDTRWPAIMFSLVRPVIADASVIRHCDTAWQPDGSCRQ